MPHTLALGRGYAGNVGDNRLAHIRLDIGSRLFFRGTTDFTNHYDGLSSRILLKHLQDIDKVRARDRITTDTYTSRLAVACIGSLLHSFIRERTGTRYDAYFSRKVNMTRHNTDLAFARGDHAGAVGTYQTHAQLVTAHLGFKHIQRGDAFSNTHNQLDAAVRRFEDRILTEGCRHVDNRSIRASGGHRIGYRIEYRQTQVLLSAFPRGHTANHLCAVLDSLL